MRLNGTRFLSALVLALAPTALATTTWYVNGVRGSDSNNCSSAPTACKTIGHAILLAASGDSIVVAPAIYTENLTIGKSLKVIGFGASAPIIDGRRLGTVVTISNTGAHVTISKVTIRNGAASFGGGVSNLGMLTLSHVIIRGNRASLSCMNTCSARGGGIYNLGMLTINDSTITQNSVQVTGCAQTGLHLCGVSATGGGIYQPTGRLTINNSTISRNSTNGKCLVRSHCFAQVQGGGILNFTLVSINTSTISGNTPSGIYSFGGTVAINNSTISENGGLGPAIVNDPASTMMTINNSTISENLGEGIGVGARVQNSIVANNLGFNCVGSMTSKGYNLSSDKSCNFNGPGDMNNISPMLGPLQNNGGPTQTQALLPGSPAVDAGDPSGCRDNHGHLLKTDQRGKPAPTRRTKPAVTSERLNFRVTS
jgi:hypothetical protein